MRWLTCHSSKSHGLSYDTSAESSRKVPTAWNIHSSSRSDTARVGLPAQEGQWPRLPCFDHTRTARQTCHRQLPENRHYKGIVSQSDCRMLYTCKCWTLYLCRHWTLSILVGFTLYSHFSCVTGYMAMAVRHVQYRQLHFSVEVCMLQANFTFSKTFIQIWWLSSTHETLNEKRSSFLEV